MTRYTLATTTALLLTLCVHGQELKKLDQPVKVKVISTTPQMLKDQVAKKANAQKAVAKEFRAREWKEDPLNVKMYKLKNGLTVLLSENHDVPQVFGTVVVKAGGKNDPADATGIAHYLEHMLFKGTETMGTTDYQKEKPYLDKINDLYEELGKTTDEEQRKGIQKQINEQSIKAGEYAIANEIDKVLAQIGATGVNAFTTEDYTAYINTFPANQVGRWLEIYSHRFEKPVFRLFQSELETVYEEKNRSMDDGFSQVFEEFLKNFWKEHPYGQQTILGTTEHLKNPPLKKMYEYFDKHYVANNMALILSGDFNSEEIIPLIDAKFGDWRKGKVGEFNVAEEKPFNGRELIEVRMTPVKVGALGYRSPKNGHPDKPAMDVLNNLLSNAEQSGMIDELTVDGDVMFAGMMPMAYNDHGASLVIFVPKIVGQSLDDAEEKVKAKLAKLRNGEFDDKMLAAVKKNMMSDLDRRWEDNQTRTMAMMEAFTQNRGWGDYLKDAGRLEAVTREDVIRVANEYLGDNYLCLQSKMGFPKKDKLDKPGFEPVIPKNEVKSEFRNVFEQIPASAAQSKYVNFKTDVQSGPIQPGVTLHTSVNPFNDLYTLEIHYGIGRHHQPLLGYLGPYLESIGTQTMSANEFKQAMYQLGCSYGFTAEDESFIVTLEGRESDMEASLKLMAEFLKTVKPDPAKVKKLVGDIQANNKINRRQPSHISTAAGEYVLYGNNSAFHRQLTAKQMKKLTAGQLHDALAEALTYACDVVVVSRLEPKHVTQRIKRNFTFGKDLKPKKPTVVRERIAHSENTIYVIPKKKAVQSQLIFYKEGRPFTLKQAPHIDAFNSYFGGNMSALVFQEIREFRSLAYSAWARYMKAEVGGKPNHFWGYIGCQGDKTMDALTAMTELIENMPEKAERWPALQNSLVEKAQSSRPDFRYLYESVDAWKDMGYTDDPNKLKVPEYGKLTFDDITAFHKAQIKGKPMVICVTGDPSRFDTKALAKYGTVKVIKEKELFVN